MSPMIPAVDYRVMCLKLRGCYNASSKRTVGNSAANSWCNVPDSAWDLLSRTLDPNPVTRISAAEALQHPFLLWHQIWSVNKCGSVCQSSALANRDRGAEHCECEWTVQQNLLCCQLMLDVHIRGKVPLWMWNVNKFVHQNKNRMLYGIHSRKMKTLEGA